MTSEAISPAVRVGHVHLRVADLDRAIAFYRDGLGLGLVANGRPAGLDAAFSPPATTTTTSPSTPGTARAAILLRPATPASTTSRSCIPTGASWAVPSSD